MGKCPHCGKDTEAFCKNCRYYIKYHCENPEALNYKYEVGENHYCDRGFTK